MKLLIDAGNTRTKWVWAHANSDAEPAAVFAFDNANWLSQQRGEAHIAFAAAVATATEIWISNVAGNSWAHAFEALGSRAAVHCVQATDQALRLHNGYRVASQLGSDRWCSAIAAWADYQRAALVVNAGTAVTIDVLQMHPDFNSTKSGVFAGGSIQPGLQLMWQSLQQQAAQLGLNMPESLDAEDLYPRSTAQAMLQGCLQAVVGAVALQYETLCSQSDEVPLVLLSGGDAPRLAPYLTQRLSVQPIIVDNLVLRGLAYLAESAAQ